MAKNSENSGGLKSLVDELPFDRLKDELSHGFGTLGEKALGGASDRLTGLTDRLNDMAENGGFAGKVAKKSAEEAAEGGSPVKGALKGGLSGAKDKVKEKLGGGGGGGGKKGTKATNIIEEIDVGVPVSVAYNAWTEFQEWTGFMKKVEKADAEEETKINFKAQVFWSHREWQGKILEQVPDEKIMWRSEGEKGRVDGAVTFHELAPNLTRILVVLEYYPQGLFERTGNLWRAQGRRARLELKHFRRHVMTEIIQDPDEVEGWRGVIEEGELVRSHDEVVEEEQQDDGYDEADGEEPEGDEVDDEYDEADDEDEAADEYEDEDEDGDEDGDEAADEYDEEEEELEDEPEDEYDEEDGEEDGEEEEPDDGEEELEDEYDEEGEDEDEESEEEPEDEYEDEEPEEEEVEEERPRRRRRAA